MSTIKLNYESVTSQLKQVTSAKETISLSSSGMNQLGQNHLAMTEKWKEQEQAIQQLVQQYVQAVTKNIEDTQANIDLLKKQDEAMIRN
ncbi:DUF5344 family protein [Metabacillus iocasae]|uniref:Transcription initiation factor IIF auxiliary subunit n=1 Tax=Priestia iocasae TaxID=2291674 RepID=A0ABS2QVS6_9BACI|nr:DUF5344 family protein [Metabacillus iocasae]MBM7703047.1 transcription initiation factor IIF auxiliary subunit [Metabacillus iocasae]